MKRVFTVVLMVTLIFTVILTGCDIPKEDKEVALGVYIYEESEEIVKQKITLEEDNQFSLTHSASSSYISAGTYEIVGDKINMNTSDEKYSYVFDIAYETLVFNEEESSSVREDLGLPNKAVFKK